MGGRAARRIEGPEENRKVKPIGFTNYGLRIGLLTHNAPSPNQQTVRARHALAGTLRISIKQLQFTHNQSQRTGLSLEDIGYNIQRTNRVSGEMLRGRILDT